ncbi:MAG: alanine racemase [Geminicoccaceae bacterium]|nr:MAG: alanine racemase [Geminicoccaceae bacterium]
MRIWDVDTPAVLVDLDRVERNLTRFQAYCDRHGIANRPHVKTHKVVEFARRQVELGAVGICCQKLGEAEVMASAGLGDILVPFNLLGPAKLGRARALAERITLEVSADDPKVVDGLAEAFASAPRPLPVLVECDTGAKRCGVQTPEAARDLARRIDRARGLRFAGLMTYPAKGAPARAAAFLAEAKALIEAEGLAVAKVSSGGTPDMWRVHEYPVVTEYRVGTYIYNDLMEVACGAATLDDCALTVLTTVVSRPTSDRAILDAGSKSLTSDLNGQTGHGRIVEYPEAVIYALSEEHGHVDLSACSARPAIGEKVRVIPNHACPVSNLFDRIVTVRGDRVEGSLAVAARGRVD